MLHHASAVHYFLYIHKIWNFTNFKINYKKVLILFTHSSVNKHLRYSTFLGYYEHVAMNILVQAFILACLWDKHIWTMHVQHFQEPPDCLPKQLHHLHSQEQYTTFWCLTSLSTLLITCLFYYSCTSGCELYSFQFSLLFLIVGKWCWTSLCSLTAYLL